MQGRPDQRWSGRFAFSLPDNLLAINGLPVAFRSSRREEEWVRSDQQRLGDLRTTVLVPEAIIPHETARRPRWGLWMATLLLGMFAGLALAWSFGMMRTKADEEVASAPAIAAPSPPMPPRSPYPAELPDLFAHSAPLPAPTLPPVVAPMPEPSPVAVEPKVPSPLAAPRRAAPEAAAKAEHRRPLPPPEPAAAPVRPAPRRALPLSAPAPRPAAVERPSVAPRPARSLSGPLVGLFMPGDYPALARRGRDQGDVTVRLTIGFDGRVARCAVLASNASRTLETATCAVLTSRARFAPATDLHGSAVSDAVVQPIAWRLP